MQPVDNRDAALLALYDYPFFNEHKNGPLQVPDVSISHFETTISLTDKKGSQSYGSYHFGKHVMITNTQIDKMNVMIFESRSKLGNQAAKDFADIVIRAVAQHGEASVILATGNSQRSFFEALRHYPEIPWNKITVFHMDEYLGMSTEHSASFQRYIKEQISDVFHPGATYGIQGDASDIQAELTRYTNLLEAHKPVVCVMGIGENGHLAFNDPPADFNTTETIHVVTLDQACRQQQVGEGHFASFDDVPKEALSLTIPALLRPLHVMVIVPESRKAIAVRNALYGPITKACPASILRTQEHVKLYLDQDSSTLISTEH